MHELFSDKIKTKMKAVENSKYEVMMHQDLRHLMVQDLRSYEQRLLTKLKPVPSAWINEGEEIERKELSLANCENQQESIHEQGDFEPDQLVGNYHVNRMLDMPLEIILHIQEVADTLFNQILAQ